MKKEWWRLIFVSTLFILIRFFPIIFLGKTFVFGDNYSLMVPGKIYLAEYLKQGILPLWNPEIFSGIPLINDINQSVLYFTTGIFYLFEPALALNLSIIIHLLLIILGTYLLLKHLFKNEMGALLGSLLMALSTQVSGSINNLSTIQSVTWLPWIAYWGLKLHDRQKFVYIYGIFVLIHFLAGYPQHVIYAIAFSVLLSGFYGWKKINFWRWFKTWLLTAVVVLLVSAVAWLPFLEMLLDSTRMAQSLEQAQVGSLKPAMMIKAVFPYFFDKQSLGIKWGPSWSGQPNVFFYLSNFALLILAVTFLDKKQRRREDWFYFIFLASTILFSLGSYLPGFDLIQRLIPLFKFGRYPSMILLFTNLAMIIWLASAYRRVKIHDWQLKLFVSCWISIIVLALICFYVIYFDFSNFWQAIDHYVGGRLANSTFHTVARDFAISKMIVTNLLTAGLLAVLAALAFKKQKKLIFVLILVADVLIHTQSMFYFAPLEIYDYQDMNLFVSQMQNYQYRSLIRNSNMPYTDFGTYWEAMTTRKPFSDSFIDDKELENYQKLIHIRNAYTPNWNMIKHISTIHGYAALLPRDYAEIWAQKAEARINFVDYIEPSDPKLQDWAVKYYLVDYAFAIKEEIPFKEVARKDNYVVYELPSAKARFRLENDQELELTDFSENPNQISFTFNNTDQNYLIIADRYDRNWQAWINNQEVEIENFNGMRRLKIEIGSNRLIMCFIPKTFYFGLGISLFSFLIFFYLTVKSKD